MWGTLKLDNKNRESGLWLVKAYLGDFFISEKQFLIANSRSELELLEKQIIASGIQLDTENTLNNISTKISKFKHNGDLHKSQLKIAVVEFQSLGFNKEKSFVGKMISEMFTTEVANSEAFKIIERDQLKKVLDEIAVGQSGIIDTSDARQLGKILGADAIITGSVMKIEEELRIDSRMIEVKTGVIMSAERKICKEILSDISSKVIEMTDSLSEKFYQKNTAE